MSRIITSDGADIAFRDARARFRLTGSDAEFQDLAVRHLGDVWYRATPSALHIKIAPDCVAHQAVCELHKMLESTVANHVRVTLVSDDPPLDRICFSAAEASAAIRRAVKAARDKKVPRFLKRSSTSFALGNYPTLDRLLKFYNFNSRIVERGQLQALASQTLQGRFLIVERNNDGTLRIQALGMGYRGFDRGWCSRSNGERIEDQPDLDYGVWLREYYRAVLAEKLPKLDMVDAIIFRPKLGRRRFNYRRLVLPFEDPTGSQFLLSASITDPTVDLRTNDPVEVF